jgi:muconate cycloisomerase
MRFVGLDCYVVRLPFRFTYRHALAERRENHSVLVRLRLDAGPAGWGEGLPRSYLTGETVESVLASLRAWWPQLREVAAVAPGSILDALGPLYRRADAARQTAAYTALELAALDAVGRATGQPVRRFIAAESPPRRVVHFTGPLGGGSLPRTRRLALLLRLLRYRDVKLKVGAADDADRLAAIRAALGPRADLRVDANAAWDLPTALQRAEALRAAGVSSLEQPLPAAELEAAARLQRESGLPLMADESLCTRADADALVEAGACRLFNLRLAKCGGISGCLALRERARAAGLDCQLGVLVGETGILAAAERELLAAVGPLRHHEHPFTRLLLKGSPTSVPALPRWRGASALAAGRPGLGVRVRQGRLAALTVERHTLAD